MFIKIKFKFKEIFNKLQRFRSPETIKKSERRSIQPYEKHFYNLSMTYRIDSDIDFSYGMIVDITSGKKISPAMNIKWITPNANFSSEL